MNAREKIRTAIKQNKPSNTPLPDVPLFDDPEENVLDKFRQMVETIGGYVIEMTSLTELDTLVSEKFSNARNIVSSIVTSTVTVNQTSPTELLERTDIAILKGEWGVAENGSIWLPEQNMLHRALPFITQHLLLVLKKENIVANMHVAYEKVATEGYGVFIAGPSKTADIEQSLVIGAHGARSLTVVIH